MGFKSMCNNVKGFCSKNSTTILTTTSVLGVIGTAVTSFVAGYKSRPIIDEYKDEMSYVDQNDKAAKKDVRIGTAKKLAPKLVAPVLTTIGTSACSIGSNKISSKRIETLSVAYALAEKGLKEWKEKTEEVIGESKKKEVQDRIAKKHMDQNPPPKDESAIVMTGDGNVLCFDSFSGRYFYSNAEKIRQAVGKISDDCRSDMYASLNDFYDELKLRRLPAGDEYGWNADCLAQGILPISLSALLTEDNKPCIAVEYDVFPRDDYRRLM